MTTATEATVFLSIEDKDTGETREITDPAEAITLLAHWVQDDRRRLTVLEREVDILNRDLNGDG